MEQDGKTVPGVADFMLDPQVLIPKMRIEVKREKLALNCRLWTGTCSKH